MLKKISGLIILLFVLTMGSVHAFADTVKISELPEYIRHDNFKLSYSALSENPVTAQFFFRKEGDSYAPFGSVINSASGQIQVGGAQIDEQKKYYFKVVINNGPASDETTVIYDHSGPSPVQSYWKEKIGGGHYRLHWKTPGDSDFSRVFIYRSDSLDFTADPSTKIGELGGAPDEEKDWDNFGLDPNTTYYYALRAIDKAGNSSSVVADPEVTATRIEETIVGGTAGEEVILFPSGEGTGQVLGEEEEDVEEIVVEEPETAFGEAVDTLTGTTKGRIAAVSAFVIGLILYFFTRRRRQ
jgi:hypothetical protein